MKNAAPRPGHGDHCPAASAPRVRGSGAPNNGMVHIAMHESLDGNHVTWMEHVTDEEYGVAVGK